MSKTNHQSTGLPIDITIAGVRRPLWYSTKNCIADVYYDMHGTSVVLHVGVEADCKLVTRTKVLTSEEYSDASLVQEALLALIDQLCTALDSVNE